MLTLYEKTANELDQAARLLLASALPLGVGVRDAHVAYFYRQSFEVIFRALSTHAQANALVNTCRVTVEQGAGKQIAYIIMLMQTELLGQVNEQVYSEAEQLVEAWEQVVSATRRVLGPSWPEGRFPNYVDIGFAHQPRGRGS